jgi:hypothetical protein
VSANIKDILYSAIDKIGRQKIRMEINADIKRSEPRCHEILAHCTDMMGKELDDQAAGNLLEALLHFMLTASMLPSERKVNWEGLDLDLVLPSLKTLVKSPDKALVIQIVRTNEELTKLVNTKSVQPHNENIWVVSTKPLNTKCKNYYASSAQNPYCKIISDINMFLTDKGNREFRLFQGQ